MRPVSVFTDFFVICHGNNTRQAKAIFGEVQFRMKSDERVVPVSVDGDREATWIVADYLDVVLHVFTPETRGYYRLEDLWSDVPSETIEAASV
jgi:ribosome-associated protein